MNPAFRRFQDVSGRLGELREPVGVASRRARTLAGELARGSESQRCPAEQSRSWFVAADRLGELAHLLAQAERALPGPGEDSHEPLVAAQRVVESRLLENVIGRLNLLVLECALRSEKSGAGIAGELEQLTKDVAAIRASWQTLAADAAWAAREAGLPGTVR